MFKSHITQLFVLFIVSILFCCEENGIDEKPFDNGKASEARLTNDYTFDGTEGDPIDLDLARSWANNFREQNTTGTIAHFFGTEILNQLLAEEGCVGLRIYYGIDDEGNRQLLIVGVDEKGNDLLPATGVDGRVNDDGNIVADFSYPCPTYCSGPGI